MGVMTPTIEPANRRHDTLGPMPSKGTDRRTIRVDPELWDEFGVATESWKDGRSGVLREYMRWFLKKPQAFLPRPDGDQSEE